MHSDRFHPLHSGAARYVWEIALGAHAHFAQEESLVEVDVVEDQTMDVIGDVHGAFLSWDCSRLVR